jgi:hypothetical protein
MQLQMTVTVTFSGVNADQRGLFASEARKSLRRLNHQPSGANLVIQGNVPDGMAADGMRAEISSSLKKARESAGIPAKQASANYCLTGSELL